MSKLKDKSKDKSSSSNYENKYCFFEVSKDVIKKMPNEEKTYVEKNLFDSIKDRLVEFSETGR